MESNTNVLMERYELGRLLGQGTFAKVYYARSIRTGQSVAIKMIDKDKVLRVGLINQIKREISIMRLVRHPNILQLYEVMATKTKIYFVLEYAKGGELFDKVSKGRLKEDVARRYFQQMVYAVDLCHSRGVYHRDLKPENLLLDENEDMKISDFGLSALAESKRQDGLLHTTCGTPAYVAPEVINRKGYDGAKADVWSCGVILYVLLAGYLPFQDSNLIEMYRKIGKAEFKCPSWFPPEVRRLLLRILDPNPNTRISLAKIRDNSWFKKGLVNKLVKRDVKTMDVASSSSDTASGSCDEGSENVVTDRQELATLNAFDIISLSSGFDLSRLFEGPVPKIETRFSSWRPASVIISKLEEVANNLKLKMTKRDAGLLRFEGVKEGRKGALSIDAEIFQVTPAFHLIEMKKSNGDTLEYENLLKDGIRPGLQDIVWAWQGENQSHPVQDQDQDQDHDQEIHHQQLENEGSENQQVPQNLLFHEILP